MPTVVTRLAVEVSRPAEPKPARAIAKSGTATVTAAAGSSTQVEG